MSLLDVGAGAGAGLEELLARQLAEEKMGEQVRATKSTEDYRNRALDENTKLRMQQQQDSDANRKMQLQEQSDNRAARTVQFRPIGSPVTEAEYAKETAAGVPQGVYNVKEITPAHVNPQGETADTVDAGTREITQAGTEAQQNANRDDKRAGAAAEALAKSREDSAKSAEERAQMARDRLAFDKEKNQFAMDHPKDPAQIASQKAMAGKVRSHIGTIKAEADALDKAGLLGPIGGRWSDFLAGKVGTSELAAGDPTKAAMLSKFRTDVGLIQSGMAMVHGGARGGGSIQMNRKMEDLINAKRMDRPGLEGALNSFDEWLGTYQGDPDKALNNETPAGGSAGGSGVKILSVKEIP